MIPNTHDELLAENEELRRRLEEAEATVEAIKQGEVDALVVWGPTAERVYILEGADHPYHRLIESVHEGAFTLSNLGTILYCNDALVDLLQRTPKEVIGADFQTFLAEEDRLAWERLLSDISERGGRKVEVRFQRNGGPSFPARLRLESLPQGDNLTFFGVVTDLTQQKQFEELVETKRLLALSQARLRVAMEAARMVAWDWDSKGGRVFQAGTDGEVFDVKADEPSFLAAVLPEYRQRLTEALIRKGEGERFEQEYRLVQPNGAIRWVWDQGFWMRDETEGERFVGIAQDITERKRSEAQLRESEERFRQLVENIPQVFWLVEAGGKVLYVSPSYERVWGRTCATLLADPRSFLDAVHPEDRKRVSKAVDQKFEKGGYEEEYRITQPKGGVRWIKDRGFSVGDQGFAGIAEDITAQKHLEEQYRQAQKIAAVSRLAGGVAHAFNNLMTTVLGHSEIMLAGMKPSDAYFASVQAIKRSATRAATLTQQLLAFGRKQILVLRPVDLNAVVRRLERVVQNMQGGVRLGLRLEPGLRLAKTAPDQLEEAILILVRNACEAMPEGGQVTIQTANVELGSDDTDHHPEIQPGPYVLLAVSDTGVGMNEEAISHLFEPFNTKEADVGAGLGLAAVFGLVQQCGGDIEVRSEPGRGTAFRLYLPTEGVGSEEGEPSA